MLRSPEAFERNGVVAVDTNVLVRLLTRDDERQFQASYSLLEREQIYIPDSVVLELEWVLRYAYGFSAANVCSALRKLLGLRNVHVSNAPLIARTLDWHEAGLDYADATHLATSQRLPVLKTFDDRFIRRARSLSSCVVERP
jgi:predicted nucleic-acid-binding protein